MKYAKSAAVVAGSVMALGAAAPAFAVDTATPKMSLNGGLSDALNSEQMDGHQFAPLVETVKGAAEKAKGADTKAVLGGSKGTAKKATPLLGGLQIGK